MRDSDPTEQAQSLRPAQPPMAHEPTPFPGAAFDIVALAASAGGLKAIGALLTSLPQGFPAAIVVFQHLDPRHRSLMADLLSRRTNSKSNRLPKGRCTSLRQAGMSSSTPTAPSP